MRVEPAYTRGPLELPVSLALPWEDIRTAISEGSVREGIAHVIGRRERYPHPDPYRRNVDAAIAERALNARTDHYHQVFLSDPTGVPDVGALGQVRNTQSRGVPMLRVYPKDADDQVFVLVRVNLTKHRGAGHFYDALHPCVDALGWLWGHEAKLWAYRCDYDTGVCWEAPVDELNVGILPDLAPVTFMHAEVVA